MGDKISSDFESNLVRSVGGQNLAVWNGEGVLCRDDIGIH